MGESMPRQLSLGVTLDDAATFDNFYVATGSVNAQARFALRQQLTAAGEQCIFLWGGVGVGLSHLLQAACLEARRQGLQAQYLPLAELAGEDPEQLLDELDQLDLVALDDLQLIAGQAHWERALFAFFNRMRDSGRHLLLAADGNPNELALQLPDLQSRLTWGLVFHVQSLGDDEKKRALQWRARARGLELSDEVVQFILHRASRDMRELFASLERLDKASLAEQRRLTIPFVKQVLGF